MMAEKFYSEPLADIYCGHSIEILKQLPDESVQVVITSPPYWGLRKYAGGSDIIWGGDPNCDHVWGSYIRKGISGGTKSNKVRIKGQENFQIVSDSRQDFCSLCGCWRGQLGLEPTPELYVEHLIMIFREVKRVLKRGGSFWLNIGDTYAGSGMGWSKTGITYSEKLKKVGDAGGYPPPRPSIIKPGAAVTQAWPEGRLPQFDAPIPPKCMVCIPERVLFAMVEDGWSVRNKCIWRKPNNMPGSQKDRLTCSWEYLYFFVKNSNPVLWRNRETGEWRDKRPTKAENYPWGGMYYNEERNEFRWDKPPEAEKDNWVKLQPLWMSFDYYFELDQVRQPHKTESLERYQRQVNFDASSKTPDNKYIGEDVYPGNSQIYRGGRNLAPKWFGQMFPPDEDYKGKFNQMVGAGDWRAEAAKKGQLFDNPSAHQGDRNTGLKQQWIRPSRQNVPSRHHGAGPAQDKEARGRPLVAPHHPYRGDGWETQAIEGREPKIKHDIAVGRTGNVSYSDPLHTKDYSPKGRNPGDFLEIPTQPYKGAHFAVYPERLCEMPIKACSRVGDVVLDPFAGSGTTGVVAKRLGRKAILIDCVESYCALARDRIKKVEYQPELELE
jgi:DNA modification methylase